MFITKKAYEKAIQQAIEETEKKCWKYHEDNLRRNANERAMRLLEKRVQVLEEKHGIEFSDSECCFLI